MKILFLALALFCSPAFSGEMVLTENYSITVNLADSAVPDNSFLPQPAPAFVYVDPNRWTTINTVLEVAYLTVHSLDWMQTHTIAANPDKYFEYNPVLGTHPQSADINTYFAATALAHYGLARILPHGWREGFQYVTIGVETRSVVRNFSLGIGGSF